SCSDFRDMYIVEMRESVKRAKTIEMEESDMCEALEKFRDKAIAEGKLEEKMKIAYKLKIEGMSEEKIASFVECSIFQVKEWLSKSNDCLV
ncbi:MAG: hypothetical protein ACI4UK_08875, partial [Floccifex sp.]